MLEVKPETIPLPDTVPPAGVSIGEAAERTGVSIHTLRYYERAGLVISPVGRTAGGSRRYGALDLKWIVICTKLRATGMPIKDIRTYADLVAAGPGNEQERLDLLEAHRRNVRTQIAALETNLELIDHKIEVYRGHLEAGDADRLWAPGSRQPRGRRRSREPSSRDLRGDAQAPAAALRASARSVRSQVNSGSSRPK